MGESLQIDEFNGALSEFRKDEKDPMHRYQSWQFCYSAFKDALTNKNEQNIDSDVLADELAKELTIYLASWGMMRGSSKLLTDYNYKIHIDLIKEIIDKKDYFCYLYGETTSRTETKGYISKTLELGDEIKKYYNKKGVSSTKTLVTKIILGIFGASPAFDEYACNAMEEYGFTQPKKKKFSEETLGELWTWYFGNKAIIKKDCKYYDKGNKMSYPPMKIMDMALFIRGSKLKEPKESKSKEG